MVVTSSLGGPLDPEAVKPVKGKFISKHSPSHVDCLVGAKEGPNYKEDCYKYLNKIRPAEVISFSGLNTRKLLGKIWKVSPHSPPTLESCGDPLPIPSGKHENKTVPQVMKNVSGVKFLSIIYGSNNRNFFTLNLPVENVLQMFFTELNLLLGESNFEVVFISTVFPRAEDLSENGEIQTQIKEFNDYFLSHKARSNRKLRIFSKNGGDEERIIRWVPVDMTKHLPYHDMKNEKYYCEKNSYKNNDRKDLTHINAKYLKLFYLELDSTIVKYIQDKKKFKKRRLV